jgi:hypothetical protein
MNNETRECTDCGLELDWWEDDVCDLCLEEYDSFEDQDDDDDFHDEHSRNRRYYNGHDLDEYDDDDTLEGYWDEDDDELED